MSADNWGVCPKCKNDDAKELAAKYGKISAEEYIESVEKFKNRDDSQIYVLREDYVIGIGIDGEFYISYQAQCTRCGFSFAYKHQERVLK